MWSKQEEKSHSDLSKETEPTAAVDQRRGHERLAGQTLTGGEQQLYLGRLRWEGEVAEPRHPGYLECDREHFQSQYLFPLIPHSDARSDCDKAGQEIRMQKTGTDERIQANHGLFTNAGSWG